MGLASSSQIKEGLRHDYLVNNKSTADENGVLNDVYQFFRKYSTQTNDSNVVIPKAEFECFKYNIEVALRRQSRQEKEIQEPAPKENSKSSIVYLLNTSKNLPAKSFSCDLQDSLCDMCFDVQMITLSEVLDIDPENVLMIICNKLDKDTPQQAVDMCLESIKEDHYASIILIMLHVRRKPPQTRTQRQLLSSDHDGKYKRIGMVVDMAFDSKNGIYDCDRNKEAFSEILNFFCDYDSTHTGTHMITEKCKIETSQTYISNASEVGWQNCSDVPKPTAYIMETSRSEASSKFVNEFKKKLKSQSVILKAIQDCDDSKLESDMFLILVCSITSRLEADVDQCLSAISSKQYSSTILVVLHISNKTDLRSTSSRKLLEVSQEKDKKYDSLSRIIDMAYNKDKGIYQCEMNTDAFKELEKIYVSRKNTVEAKTSLNENETSNNDTDDTKNRNDLQLDKPTTEASPEKKQKTDNLEDNDPLTETQL